jgi:four helix bundle protein
MKDQIANSKNEYRKTNMALRERIQEFCVRVIHFIESLGGRPGIRVIGDQVIRSSTSIGSNVVEAQSASSRKDFTNYLNHALKSANETIFWFEMVGHAHKVDVRYFIQESTEFARILGSSILTLKGRRNI